MKWHKRAGMGLLSIFAATGIAHAEEKIYELSGTPLHQLVTNCMAVHAASLDRQDEQVWYSPNCDLVTFVKDKKVTKSVKVDKTTAQEFEQWMDSSWIKTSNPDTPCQNGICIYTLNNNLPPCNQLTIENVDKFISIQGGIVSIIVGDNQVIKTDGRQPLVIPKKGTPAPTSVTVNNGEISLERVIDIDDPTERIEKIFANEYLIVVLTNKTPHTGELVVYDSKTLDQVLKETDRAQQAPYLFTDNGRQVYFSCNSPNSIVQERSRYDFSITTNDVLKGGTKSFFDRIKTGDLRNAALATRNLHLISLAANTQTLFALHKGTGLFPEKFLVIYDIPGKKIKEARNALGDIGEIKEVYATSTELRTVSWTPGKPNLFLSFYSLPSLQNSQNFNFEGLIAPIYPQRVLEGFHTAYASRNYILLRGSNEFNLINPTTRTRINLHYIWKKPCDEGTYRTVNCIQEPEQVAIGSSLMYIKFYNHDHGELYAIKSNTKVTDVPYTFNSEEAIAFSGNNLYCGLNNQLYIFRLKHAQ